MISAKIPNETRKQVYRRDGYRCALCDCTKYLQIHHYIPRGKGGNNSPHNLITLCTYCHAHVHGHNLFVTDLTADDIDQMICEYLADYYADKWDPYH